MEFWNSAQASNFTYYLFFMEILSYLGAPKHGFLYFFLLFMKMQEDAFAKESHVLEVPEMLQEILTRCIDNYN